MKTKTSSAWTAVCLSMLTAMAAYRASADQTATTVKPEKTYTGTIVSIATKERMLDVKGLMLSKKFNLGDACAYIILSKGVGAIGDLRPGQRVTVSYQDANGVLIADRVAQQPMREEGMIKAIDPAQHTLTLSLRAGDKTFQLPADCQIVLRGGKSGTLADIQTGNHVTVTYEIPNEKVTAREIAQTSVTFTGDLTAIDLGQKTLKAKTMFTAKKFNVGDNCAILVNGKPEGKLSDLTLNKKFVFSYDDINGINVVNRIAPVETPKETETTAAQPATP